MLRSSCPRQEDSYSAAVHDGVGATWAQLPLGMSGNQQDELPVEKGSNSRAFRACRSLLVPSATRSHFHGKEGVVGSSPTEGLGKNAD